MESSSVIEKIRFYLPAFTLSAWGIVFLQAVSSGRENGLLHPLFRPLVFVAGLLLLGLSLLYLAFFERAPVPFLLDTKKLKRRFFWTDLNWLLLLAPLLVAALVAGNQFSGNVVEARGLEADTSTLPALNYSQDDVTRLLQFISDAKPGTALPMSVQDLMTAATAPEVENRLEGREIVLSGQYYPANEEEFKVLRLFMFCCAADAVPVSVIVKGKPVSRFKKMDWVEVKGLLHFQRVKEDVIPEMDLKVIEPTAAPADPYLY